MIVVLGDGIAVNPDFVISVGRSFHDTHILVRTSDGHCHEVQRGYGETIWAAEKRIVALLNPPAKEPRDENERSG